MEHPRVGGRGELTLFPQRVQWVRPANVAHGGITTRQTAWDYDVSGKIPKVSTIQTSL